ncbi:hypothetical protein [Bacillus thuringiensis]|uniref:hypothetical protein n=1 Tax=Bacillus thuringiensis TaxID=1428 RepID=UPI0015D4DAF0|nr:hypothetical protein [Bacillus thuringiensis]
MKRKKKKLFSMGAAFGFAFADFDPSTPPPEYKQVTYRDETSGDPKKNQKLQIKINSK